MHSLDQVDFSSWTAQTWRIRAVRGLRYVASASNTRRRVSWLQIEVDARGDDVMNYAYRVQGEHPRLHMFASGQVIPVTGVKPNEVIRTIETLSQGAA
jgi:hypothetical protein